MAPRYRKASLTCYQELARSFEKKGISFVSVVRCALDAFFEDFPHIQSLYATHSQRVSVSKNVLRQLERELASEIDALRLARQLRYLARFGDRIPPIEHVRAKRWPTREMLQ